jgi:hypothetical protein
MPVSWSPRELQSVLRKHTSKTPQGRVQTRTPDKCPKQPSKPGTSSGCCTVRALTLFLNVDAVSQKNKTHILDSRRSCPPPNHTARGARGSHNPAANKNGQESRNNNHMFVAALWRPIKICPYLEWVWRGGATQNKAGGLGGGSPGTLQSCKFPAIVQPCIPRMFIERGFVYMIVRKNPARRVGNCVGSSKTIFDCRRLFQIQVAPGSTR